MPMISTRQEFKWDAIHGDKSQSRVRWRCSDDDWMENGSVGSVGSAFGAGGKVLNGDTIIITQDGGSEAFLPQPTANPGQNRR